VTARQRNSLSGECEAHALARFFQAVFSFFIRIRRHLIFPEFNSRGKKFLEATGCQVAFLQG
jgi:hypothetical protein